jgi:hypothetical protein
MNHWKTEFDAKCVPHKQSAKTALKKKFKVENYMKAKGVRSNPIHSDQMVLREGGWTM